MTNVLLENHTLPPFSSIRADQIVPAIKTLTGRNRQRINELVQNTQKPTWENFIAPLEAWDDEINQAWSPVGHLSSVADSPELREAYKEGVQILSEYATELGQHKGLYDLYLKLKRSDNWNALSTAQKKSIDDMLINFELSGISLPEQKQQEFAELNRKNALLTNQFSENVLDATQGWSKSISDISMLTGIPETGLGTLAQNAKLKEQDGWLINLEFPSYLPVMTYADNRELRQEVYEAFVTRASDQGPNAGKWDNAQNMADILNVRIRKAELLGYQNWSEVSLVRKMAEEPKQVLDFLYELAEKSLPQAKVEVAELAEFASSDLGIKELQPWDLAYASEKLKQQKYAISDEELRPYFPVDRVISGLFETASRIFGVTFQEQQGVDLYHPDVKFYQVMENGNPIAGFYLDLYARSGKRGGAWMDECRVRRSLNEGVQNPVAYLTCNFTAPIEGKPSLLTHNEVTTLFHEFGHGLHHMLTKIDVAAVSGINGVAWDAVELPSQFMENFCYQPEALSFISGHHESGEPLPEALLEKMLAAKNFQSAMQMMRQLEFSLYDFELHTQFRAGEEHLVMELLQQVKDKVSVVPYVPFARFQNSFSHIFSGGYAAGYYSYKWAEVLSADAFSRFEEEGVLNQTTGMAFKKAILEKGGSEPAMDLFTEFRGRQPEVEPLLRHSGIL